MSYANLNTIKQSIDKVLTEKGMRYEVSENINTLNIRLHLEDTADYKMYENLSVILARNDSVTLCMFCNNISELDRLYAFNPQIGYSLFEVSSKVALVKLIRLTNKVQLEVTLLPFRCEDSDKVLEISINQLLFALDKLKKLEIEMIEKYTEDTEATIHNLVSDAISKGTNNKGTSGKFIYVNNK